MKTFSSKGYINSCVSVPDCSTDKALVGVDFMGDLFNKNRLPLSAFLSCIKCNSGKKPVVFLDLKTGSSLTDTGRSALSSGHAYLSPYNKSSSPYSSGTGGYAVSCHFITKEEFGISQSNWNLMASPETNYPGCAVFVSQTNFAPSANQSNIAEPANLNAATLFCAACSKAYRKSPAGSNYIPYYVWKCTSIPDCQTSDWYNACSQCRTGYTWGYSITNKRIQYDYCISNSMPHCLVGLDSTANGASNECYLCDKGYYKNADKVCEKLVAPYCADDGFNDKLELE